MKTQYKYAMNENNVILRDWCNENKGRGAGLSKILFPENKNSTNTISKFKCGQQCVDDEMMEKSKSIMKMIEQEELQGKRKVYNTKLKGPSLESSKYNNYEEVKETEEFTEYKNFHRNYFMHFRTYSRLFNLTLPQVAHPSNLLDLKFSRKVREAISYTKENNLESSVEKSKHAIEACRIANKEEAKIRRVKVKTVKVAKTPKDKKEISKNQNMTAKDEFLAIVEEIASCEKLSVIVPKLLVLKFNGEYDVNTVDGIYKKFINISTGFSVIKLVNIKSALLEAKENLS